MNIHMLCDLTKVCVHMSVPCICSQVELVHRVYHSQKPKVAKSWGLGARG